MANKRYYWLKLKEDFFNSKEMKKLRKIAGGDTYVIIYLKMQLLSLKDEGKLYFEGIDDDFSSELALVLDEDVENVRVTLNFLERCGLLEIISDNEYLLSQMPELIGTETQSAERVRRHRALQCNNNVTSMKQVGNKNATPDIDIDKEIEKDIDVSDKPKKTTTKFVKPSIEEIKAYCHERGNNIDSEYFFDYYESKGWKVGNSNMKDWKATIRNWERNDKNNGKSSESDTEIITEYNAGLYEGII